MVSRFTTTLTALFAPVRPQTPTLNITWREVGEGECEGVESVCEGGEGVDKGGEGV